MNLGFMQDWPKDLAFLEPKTYFIEKINLALLQNEKIKRIDYIDSLEEYRAKFNSNWDIKPHLYPKLHTIRCDENDRWRADMNIHFVVNDRTKGRFQFVPVVKCVSVQEIEIKEIIMTANNCIKLDDGRVFTVRIDNTYLSQFRILQLARNDGFESVEDFFKYFNQDFKGKLIHWSNLKY